MRVAITGANGFIGRFLIAALERCGAEPIPLVRKPQGLLREVVIGDLSTEETRPSVPPIDSVIHLAARTAQSDDTSVEAFAAFRETNVKGTERILGLAQAAGARRFIFLSSVKVNGDESSIGKPFGRDDQPRPSGPYGSSKWEAEQTVKAFCESSGLEWIIVRPPLVYGPEAKGNFRQIVNLALSGVPLPLASANNRRSLIYVENLADFLVQCTVQEGTTAEVFFPSDGEAASTATLVREIANAAHRPARLFRFPPALLRLAAIAVGWEGVYRRLFGNLEVDSGPSAARLGWQPPFKFDQALRRTVSF